MEPSTPRKAREDRALAHGRSGRTLAGGAPSPEYRGLPPSDTNDSENVYDDKEYLLGHPPQENDVLLNEKGQSVIAVLDPKGNLRWRDLKTQQWATAPNVLVEGVPLPLTGYGPASQGSARRRRSGDATRRYGAVDGFSEVSSVLGSWEDVPTEQSFGTFAAEDKSQASASEDSPQKQSESPPTPKGSVPVADGGEESSPSFADPAVAAPVPAGVQAMLREHAGNELVVGVIQTMLSAEVEESKIVNAANSLLAAQAKSQTPVDGGGPAVQEDPKSKIFEFSIFRGVFFERLN